jgi:hypothetical protein
MKTTIFTEQLDLSEASVDSAARVLRNVVLIRAGTSANRRHYSEQVLSSAAPVFEGVKAYDGHERRARRVAETTGWYANVRYENGALRADRYFSGTQAGRDVQSVAEDIVSGRAPRTLAGLSINATGQAKPGKLPDGDALVVEAITAAESVDDVSSPAAGGAYLEHVTGDALAASLIEAMSFEDWFESKPDFVKRLQNEMKTARQDEALKAVQAEAKSAADALQEAQATIERLTQEREAAVLNEQTARRDLAVEQTLNDPRVKLPVSWKADVRAKLTESDPQAWVGLIEGYQRLASTAGHKPLVAVSGAGQQVSEPVLAPVRVDPIVSARQRLAEARSPEDLQRIQATLER